MSTAARDVQQRDLDLNSNEILNLAAPTAASSGARLQDVQQAVNEATLDETSQAAVLGTTETVIKEWLVDFDRLTPSTIKAALSAIVSVTLASTGTYNLRIGGTIATADGTVRATFTTTSLADETKTNQGASFAKPSGVQTVKLCAVDSTALAQARARAVVVCIYGV